MKILYIITRSEVGGAQAVVLAYLRNLKERVELALVTGEEGFLADEARTLGVSVFVVPSLVPAISPRLDCQATRALYKIIRSYHPDLIHAHSSKAGLLGRLAANLAGVPSIFTAHGFAFAENARPLRRLIAIPSEWAAAKLGRAVIAVSYYDADLALRRRVVQKNLSVIHNGIPDVPFRSSPHDNSQVNIVMVARFAPPKAHELVLRSLKGSPPNFNLWFIGDGPTESQVRAEATTLGLAERTVFMGNRRDVPELLSKAHVFVLASRHEGLPISILEAMRAGLPVVASDVGGVRECVRDHDTGFLVQRNDIEGMRSSLAKLIASPALRQQMGQSGRQLFSTNFTERAMIDKTLEVYKTVLQRSSPKDERIGTAAIAMTDTRS